MLSALMDGRALTAAELATAAGITPQTASAHLARLMEAGLLTMDVIKPPARRGGRIFSRPCLDWSERRPHIAGAVGAALCGTYFRQGWIRRSAGSRAVTITPQGQIALRKAFGPNVIP